MKTKFSVSKEHYIVLDQAIFVNKFINYKILISQNPLYTYCLLRKISNIDWLKPE
jgi:hypothetical protein